MNKNTRHGQILLTPGPLTTSDRVRAALTRDWGSRDKAFIAMTARIRETLCRLAGAEEGYSCIPVQGSGTFAVEATLGTLLPRADGKCLILINGAYGKRMAKICDYLGRAYEVYETAEDTPPDPEAVSDILSADEKISLIAMVHCETTSGILNPVRKIAAVAREFDRKLIIDAMSSFGALPIDLAELGATALIASANKCLQGAPGLGYAIIENAALAASKDNAASLSLDLHDQAEYMDRSGQWRFTPPTHVVAALDQAMAELAEEGGIEARGSRYQANCDRLVSGLTEMGFELFLPSSLQAPIIVTIRTPADPAFDFIDMYDALNEKGIILYPGAVTQEKTFRIGCIGDIGPEDIAWALEEIAAYLSAKGLGAEALKAG